MKIDLKRDKVFICFCRRSGRMKFWDMSRYFPMGKNLLKWILRLRLPSKSWIKLTEPDARCDFAVIYLYRAGN